MKSEEVFPHRPELNQLVIYKNVLYRVTGFKFAQGFVTIESLDGQMNETIAYFNARSLDIFIDDIRDVKTLEDLKEKYPEYCL